MADLQLTQAEADSLISMPKQRLDDAVWDYPGLGGNISIPLVSEDKRESFFLDIRRGRIDLSKGTYQNRTRKVIILVRLDFGGSPHRNPDGHEIACPHLHVYREGFGDKWAIPVPQDVFSDYDNLRQALDDFMRYCNIVIAPNIQWELFE